MSAASPPSPPPSRYGSDPLFPAAALLPLAEPLGGHTPAPNDPGQLRPFVATLAVRPLASGKKHDTNPSRWTEDKPTQISKDGQVEPDTTPVVHTDS